MNSSVWVVWAVRAVREKKVDLRNSEQLLRVVFSTFGGQNKHFKKFLNYCMDVFISLDFDTNTC